MPGLGLDVIAIVVVQGVEWGEEWEIVAESPSAIQMRQTPGQRPHTSQVTMAAPTSDYLIVGGGTAGCVVASRLHQALPRSSITLLEAGRNEHENPLVQSNMTATQLHDSDVSYNWRTVPQTRLNGRQIRLYGGRLLSGGSGVNYGLWTRGHAEG